MTEQDHKKYARRMLATLIDRVQNFEGGDKFITYGALAKEVDYPEPHIYNIFGSRIGKTLSVMGHMLDGIIVDGMPVPFIQTMVVGSSSKLPSDGLSEFDTTYPNLSTQKKRDYANAEYAKIFEFGTRWEQVLERLEIAPANESSTESTSTGGLYNPYGSEGSPEHRALRDYVATHPELVGADTGLQGITEYPLKSGDKVDVVFESEGFIWGVEVKSRRSGTDDLERGIYQCIKYAAVLKAECLANRKNKQVSCCLALESELPVSLSRKAKKLDVKTMVVSLTSL